MSGFRHFGSPVVLANGASLGVRCDLFRDDYYVTVDGRPVGGPLGSRKRAELIATWLTENFRELAAEIDRP